MFSVTASEQGWVNPDLFQTCTGLDTALNQAS